MQTFSEEPSTHNETYLNDQLYKFIPPPIPLIPKKSRFDTIPRSFQQIRQLLFSYGPTLNGKQPSSPFHPPSHPPASCLLPSVSFQSTLQSKTHQTVYKRGDIMSLLNIKKLLRVQQSKRTKPVQNQETEPYYTPKPGEKTLVFQSRFQSGNLAQANKITDNQYNLFLSNDVNSKGHTQWFYFKVSNTTQALSVKFNIVNLGKEDSLFNQGMKVLYFSVLQNNRSGTGWSRGCQNISYFSNGIRKPESAKSFYTLTFTHQFAFKDDTVYFAYSVPYTYTQLMQDISQLQTDPVMKDCVSRKLLCYTIAGNRCEYLTITAPGPSEQTKERKGIIISARVHPGESVSSWMMKGLLQFLTGNSRQAVLLRENFIFKVVPMLNPDGVINGNYRCSLAGCDLNRRWKTPSRSFHPTIYATKRLIRNFMKQRPLVLVCDLHGHSRRKNIFMYGCQQVGHPEKTRLFPFILSKLSDTFLYKGCSFKMQKSKQATMRITVYKDTRVPAVYTLEASFCGSDIGPLQGMHYTTQDLKEMGASLCRAVLVYCDIQIPRSEPQPLPDQYNENRISLLQELKSNSELLNSNLEDSSSGSDSAPSEDNLDFDSFPEFFPFSSKKKTPTKSYSKRPSRNKRITSKGSFNLSSDRRKIEPKKCLNCQQILSSGHVCPRQKSRMSTLPIRSKTTQSQPLLSKPYYNAFGKKVRDQATQTDKIPPREQYRSQTPVQIDKKSSIVRRLQPGSGDFSSWREKRAFPNLPQRSRKSLDSPMWHVMDKNREFNSRVQLGRS